MPDQRVSSRPSMAFSGVRSFIDSEAVALASRAKFFAASAAAADKTPKVSNKKRDTSQAVRTAALRNVAFIACKSL